MPVRNPTRVELLASNKKCPTMTPEIGTQLISTLGVLVVLAWYMYYNVTVTIPNVVKLHTESDAKKAELFATSAERKDQLFATTQKEITDNFSTTLREERVYRREEIGALKDWIQEKANCKYNQDRHV